MFIRNLFLAWCLLIGAVLSVVSWVYTRPTVDVQLPPCAWQEEHTPPCVQERNGLRRDWIREDFKKHWQLTAEQSSLSLGFDGARVRWQENLQGLRFLQQDEGKTSYTLVADTAEYVEGSIRLTGQVRLQAPWGEMVGDQLEVVPPSQKELLASLFHWKGHVHFRFSGWEIRCEEAEFDGASRRGRCFGKERVEVEFLDPQAMLWKMQAGEVAFRWGEGQEEVEARGSVYIRQRSSEGEAKKSGYEALAAYAQYRYGEKSFVLKGGGSTRVLLWDHARETRMSAPYIVFLWKEKGVPPFVRAEGDVRFLFQEEEYQRWKESVKTP